MGESQNKFLNGLPNTACLPRQKAGFFNGVSTDDSEQMPEPLVAGGGPTAVGAER